jgi:outer membrane protein TolC
VPIPEPLSLKQALSFATEPHPDQQMALAQQRAAEARLGVAERGQAMTVDLSGRIRWKTLQQQPEQRLGDHLLSITARKPLYDFGRSELAEQIAQGEVTQQQWGVVDAPEQKKLEIMEHFFAVLLADLQRTVEDEAMTIAYLRHKKRLDRELTGDYSELDLLQGESKFQDARVKQKQAEMAQRLTRIQLAEAMNRPGEIPSTLETPEITPEQIVKTLEAVELLQQQALVGNRQLMRSAKQVQIAERQVKQARLGTAPELDAAFEVLENSRVTSSKDRWRASLLLEVPLLDGGVNGEQVAVAREALHIARAQYELLKRKLSQQVEQYHLQLKVLDMQWQADQVAAEYREIELERNRALYEQEQRSNLGDALVGISQSHRRSAESRFQALLVRARLDQLTGKEIVIHE